MRPVVGVGAIVFDDRGRVLVIERGHPPGVGLWSVPGGKLEYGERIVDAVAREVREETGLDVEVGPLIEVIERMGDGYHYVIHDHAATVRGGTLAAGGDARAARFVDDGELAALATTDGLAPVIARARLTVAKPPASR